MTGLPARLSRDETWPLTPQGKYECVHSIQSLKREQVTLFILTEIASTHKNIILYWTNALI